MIKKIISGGQTGVDQAALDAAIEVGTVHGGYIPAGRMTEDGPLPEKYMMKVLGASSYLVRTRKNVETADATLIISRGPLTGGSALTEKIAREVNKPYLHLDLAESSTDSALKNVEKWLLAERPEILNVAGPRASSDTSLYDEVFSLVKMLLRITWK